MTGPDFPLLDFGGQVVVGEKAAAFGTWIEVGAGTTQVAIEVGLTWPEGSAQGRISTSVDIQPGSSVTLTLPGGDATKV